MSRKLTVAEALAEFARRTIRTYAWGSYEPDGGEIQDWAVELGLIREVGFDPSRHQDTEGYGFKPGDPWLEFTSVIAGRAALSNTEETDG